MMNDMLQSQDFRGRPVRAVLLTRRALAGAAQIQDTIV
jgi:hypothetical protein